MDRQLRCESSLIVESERDANSLSPNYGTVEAKSQNMSVPYQNAQHFFYSVDTSKPVAMFAKETRYERRATPGETP